jgi:hypothetical protein
MEWAHGCLFWDLSSWQLGQPGTPVKKARPAMALYRRLCHVGQGPGGLAHPGRFGRGATHLSWSVIQAIYPFIPWLFSNSLEGFAKITTLVRKFWWGSKNGVRKVAWVSWDSMCMPKYKGRMRFRDIEIFNLATRIVECTYTQSSLLSRIGYLVGYCGAETITNLALTL